MKLDELYALADRHQIPRTYPQRLIDQLRERQILPEELYEDLEMSSHYVEALEDISDTYDIVQLHSHSFYELIYCCTDCNAEYLIGSDRYRIQRGDVLFIAPGVSHRPLLPAEMPEPYLRSVRWISSDFIRQISVLLPTDPSPQPEHAHLRLLRTAGTKWESVGDLFHAGVVESETRAHGWQSALVGNTLLLLTMLQRAMYDENTTPMHAEKPELLEQVMAYVEENLAEKITLSETAKRFWVSESTICQTFRKRMGASFYRYVIQRRLIAAKLLISKGIPLEDLSVQVGFSDYSAFYRAFRQEYGVSPRRYRKMMEANEHG